MCHINASGSIARKDPVDDAREAAFVPQEVPGVVVTVKEHPGASGSLRRQSSMSFDQFLGFGVHSGTLRFSSSNR